MIRVYVAGKYSADNVIAGLNNIREGIKASVAVLEAGMAPFCPWLDYQFQFFSSKLTLQDYYDYSIAWLEASDAMFVLPGYRNSKGTMEEIKRANQLHIPVFSNMADLLEFKRINHG